LGKYNLSEDFSDKYLRYRICLEDPDTIQKALIINERDVVLSISSAGCNILNFLIYNPKKIIAVDLNQNQNHLLELKIQAMKNLDYSKFLEILGVKHSKRRIELYDKIKNKLSKDAKKFWDSKIELIDQGITYSGQSNIKKLGKFLRFFLGLKTIETFFKQESLEEQEKYFYKKINKLRVRIFFKILYIIPFLKNYKKLKQRKNKMFFLNIYKRYRHVMTRVIINNNYFLSVILLGKYLNNQTLPIYLQNKYFETIKSRLDKIEIKTSRVEDVLKKSPSNFFTKLNLSTIPDFIEDKNLDKCFKELIRTTKDNGRFCYFSTEFKDIEPRDKITYDDELANKLFKNDRSMLYLDFKVGKIIKS